MTTNDTFFDQIIAAKSALDNQPRLENKIQALEKALNAADATIYSLNIDLDTKVDITNDLQKRIAELEAGLNESRKSKAETDARLSLLMGTLRDVTGSIGVALSVIESEPEPEPVAVPTLPEPVQPITTSAETDWRAERDAVIYPAVYPEPSTNVFAANSDEARLRSEGKSWFDTNNQYHFGNTGEASAAPSVPFAPSTASPSALAQSADTITSAPSHAEPSDGASLRDILHHAYTRS